MKFCLTSTFPNKIEFLSRYARPLVLGSCMIPRRKRVRFHKLWKPQSSAQEPKTQANDSYGIEQDTVGFLDEIKHIWASFFVMEKMGCISRRLRNWYPIAA